MLLVVVSTAVTAANNVLKLDLAEFEDAWRNAIQDDMNSAISAFAGIPLHELGTATEIYEAIVAVQKAKDVATEIGRVMDAQGLQVQQYVNLQREIMPAVRRDLDGIFVQLKA